MWNLWYPLWFVFLCLEFSKTLSYFDKWVLMHARIRKENWNTLTKLESVHLGYLRVYLWNWLEIADVSSSLTGLCHYIFYSLSHRLLTCLPQRVQHDWVTEQNKLLSDCHTALMPALVFMLLIINWPHSSSIVNSSSWEKDDHQQKPRFLH